MNAKNTDTQIWRKDKEDDLSPTIHVTKEGNIGINVGGFVSVKPIEAWHAQSRVSESNFGWHLQIQGQPKKKIIVIHFTANERMAQRARDFVFGFFAAKKNISSIDVCKDGAIILTLKKGKIKSWIKKINSALIFFKKATSSGQN